MDDGCGEGSGQQRIEKRDRTVQRHEGPAGRKAVAAWWPVRCVPGLPQRLGGAGVWSRDLKAQVTVDRVDGRRKKELVRGV